MTHSSRRRNERGPAAGSGSRRGAPGAAAGPRGARPHPGPGAQQAPKVTRAQAEWGALALVLAAAAWLHARALSFGFFADDYLFLDQVRAHSLWGALTSRDPLGNFLRPLSRQLHFWIAARLGGESPVPFHVGNLAFFLISLALFERIARRFLRPSVAIAATAILALSYTADVPVLWASGSQDLMAMAFALAALWLHLGGRRGWAALAYGLALFCKETVILTPLIAGVLETGEPPARRVRHLAPMGIALALWGVVWFATRSLRPAAATTLHSDPSFLIAALLHLVQGTLALEWGDVSLREGWRLPSLFALAAALAAVLWSARGDAAGAAKKSGAAPSASNLRAMKPGGVLAGLGWAVLGALPVTAVAPIWSAYYYLYAMAGVALAVGAAFQRAPRALLIVVVALAALLNARASAREEFATASGAWTTQSHVTGFYLERAARIREQLLADLRRLRPSFPKSSSIFYSSVPSNIGWQAGDGPLVRWAYRDTSLRSYFLNQFSYERAKRGPVFFFIIENEHLSEMWRDQSPYTELALNMMLDDHPESARGALQVLNEGAGLADFDRYMSAWLEWDAGRRDSARAQLKRLGCALEPDAAPEAAQALERLSKRDTLTALSLLSRGVSRHPFDAAAHGLYSDLLLIRRQLMTTAEVEAYAARVLAPDSAWNWRRWAVLQLSTNRQRQGAMSLDHYFALAGARGDADAEAHYWRNQLQRIMPGGDLAQRGLRGTPPASGAFTPRPQ